MNMPAERLIFNRQKRVRIREAPFFDITLSNRYYKNKRVHFTRDSSECHSKGCFVFEAREIRY